MLSFRLILFTVTAGVCLWGLFALLDNLREPELMRSPQAVVVKGCDPIESEEAAKLCPQLLCQKALLESKQVPMSTRFQAMAEETRSGDDGQLRHVISGTARSGAPSSAEVRFECELTGARVSGVRLLTGRQ